MNDKFKLLKWKGVAVFGEHIAGDDLAAFKSFYGRTRRRGNPTRDRIAKSYFDHAAMKKLRFACDCRPEEKRRPLITTNKKGHLVRIEHDRCTRHSLECVFFRSQSEQRGYRHAYRPSTQDERYLLNAPFASGVADDTRGGLPERGSQEFTSRASPPSSLQRILWLLLDGARINNSRRKTFNRYQYEQINSISRYASNVVVGTLKGGIGKPISLLDILCFYPQDIGAFRRRLQQSPIINPEGGTPPPCWPRSMRPQGYLIGVVDSVVGDKLQFLRNRHPVQVHGKISIFAEGSSNSLRPPYLAILNLAALNRDDLEVSVLDAYLHPIVSEDNWTPVDSRYERRAYLSLTTTLNRLWDVGYEAIIEKPLFVNGGLIPGQRGGVKAGQWG
jgi:hypothetical protein